MVYRKFIENIGGEENRGAQRVCHDVQTTGVKMCGDNVDPIDKKNSLPWCGHYQLTNVCGGTCQCFITKC